MSIRIYLAVATLAFFTKASPLVRMMAFAVPYSMRPPTKEGSSGEIQWFTHFDALVLGFMFCAGMLMWSCGHLLCHYLEGILACVLQKTRRNAKSAVKSYPDCFIQDDGKKLDCFY
ncbi:hypothetical protein NPIL_585511 [Nephila pilipes]|uniref:Uncharacterized protein n=1 Tax=Nephila pilipes TaxID=299642 RepID=A0A8X6MEL2_NEPPI|nr:hypothetical protein NPIL_585511 [Nephila pilipes]